VIGYAKINDDQFWIFDRMTETPSSRLSGGLVTMNCSLARMLDWYLLKNFQSSSMVILFSGSGLSRLKMMLLKI